MRDRTNVRWSSGVSAALALVASLALASPVGAASGPKIIKQLVPGSGGIEPSTQGVIGVLGSLAILRADIGDGVGAELWKTDGTPNGTAFLKDINPGTNGSSAGFDSVRVGQRLLFSAFDDSFGDELWRTNGTPAGTQRVKDIAPNGDDSSNPFPWTVMDGVAYLDASDGELPGDHGDELWRSDGTAAGTRMVKDINPGEDSGFARYQARLGNRILLIASNGTSDLELFVSDGTRNGTHLVKDINEESGEGIISYPGGGPDPAVFEGRYYFQANDGQSGDPGDHGPELWRSDGTANGTKLFKEIVQGTEGTIIQWFRRAGQRLFFRASTPAKGDELWVTDGTAAGTHRVKDIWPGQQSGDPFPLGTIGPILYLTANDGSTAHGRELWRTDGTAAGTRMVKDIRQGTDGSTPYGGVVVGGVLMFVAETAKGAELWRSNGTTAGTKLVMDIRPGPMASDPAFLTRVGQRQRLIFFADDGTNGREPWTYVP